MSEVKIFDQVPEDILKRTPLFRAEWLPAVKRLREHPDAPRWNSFCGDRLTEEDLPFVKAFEEELFNNRFSFSPLPGEKLLLKIIALKNRSLWYNEKLKNIDPSKEFASIPLMERTHLQTVLERIVPWDQSLERIVVNPTSGTTGEPVPCPNHPRSVSCYDPMIKFVFLRHGGKSVFDYRRTAALQFCAQEHTITYNTVHAYTNGAGFAKINLYPREWPAPESAVRYVRDTAPVLLSGDPYSFHFAVKQGIDYKPEALLSTAVTLAPELRRSLEGHFGAPVVNIYSLNETGPLAYSCPLNPESLHILPTDVFVEITGEGGVPLPPGQVGDVVVSGGRNPFLPLLRYKTGDRAALDPTPCPCGDPMPRLVNLNARALVLFNVPGGGVVNPVDISRIIRQYPVITFQFIQETEERCILRLLPMLPIYKDMENSLRKALSDLFGNRSEIFISQDISPSEGKLLPFVNRL